jgi:hypothetical protein
MRKVKNEVILEPNWSENSKKSNFGAKFERVCLEIASKSFEKVSKLVFAAISGAGAGPPAVRCRSGAASSQAALPVVRRRCQ